MGNTISQESLSSHVRMIVRQLSLALGVITNEQFGVKNILKMLSTRESERESLEQFVPCELQ
jgi:hypothetical protein